MERKIPLIRSCFVFLEEWSTRNLNYGMTSFSYLVGISYLEAHFNSSQGFLLDYVAEPMVSIEVMILSTRVALVSKLFDPHDSICDVETLKGRRHNAESK